MPAKSAKQEKFMRAVANSPKFAKKVGVPQSVGKEFQMKDKMMKSGGMAASKMGKVKTAHPSMGSASKRADGIATKGKTKGTQVKMMRSGGKSC
jgi:hypothetical protein